MPEINDDIEGGAGEEQIAAPKTSEPSKPSVQTDYKESKEVVPELNLTVYGPCKNPKGLYIGLSGKQRDKIGVKVGDSVEVFAQGKSQGVYSVGLGSSEIVKDQTLCTANLSKDFSGSIIVRKATNERFLANAIDYKIELNAEQSEKHSDRVAIIEKRFPDMDASSYVTIPTALGRQLGFEQATSTILKISKGKIRVGDQIQDIIMVPTGTGIGFTASAAKKLSIPQELKDIKVSIDNGVLVIA